MMNLKRTGRLLTVTALAASTAMTGPLSALAQDAEAPPPLIQEAPPEIPAEPAPEPEAPPAPEPEAAPAPEPEAPAERPAPEPEAAPAPEPEAPPAREPAPEPEAPAERPAPEPERAPEPAPDQAPQPPAEPVQAAPDSGPPTNPPVGDPAELPADAGTQNDLPNGSDAAPATEAPTPAPEAAPATPQEPAAAAPEAPAAAPAPAPAPEAPPAPPAAAGETPAAPPVPAPDAQPATPPAPGAEPTAPAVNPAEPLAPPSAPTDPALRAPDGAPVAPGTPPAPPAPDGALPAPVPGAVPGQPAPGAAPGTVDPAQQSGAVAPPPVENPQPVAADIQTAPVPEGGVATSDARVQQLAVPIEVRPITAEQGQRLEAAPQLVLPQNVQVIERVGDRDILSLVGAGIAGAAAGAAAAYFIRSDDSDRLVGDSREVYYEQLPRGLTRQVITRPSGVQVITIENEYGDVIQRSRIAPDGRETVLFYDPYAEDDTRPDYTYDVGSDLPPLRLEIPEDRYVVDVSVPDEDLYYDTLVAPPVETVERIYSLNEVRRSPRIRDKVRRIDLNTITFGFGSAEIEQREVENLQALADAVKRVVDKNPGEVFLLEGHTDAVGSNVANLALSDRRAEAVASTLTEYFEIPAENLVTQGYGEENLKVDTQSENRENRRVTLRRITPLVKPVETSQAN